MKKTIMSNITQKWMNLLVPFKSEIHDCSLELIGLFDFSGSEIEYIKKLKNDRIQVQYYLKDIMMKDESAVKNFVSKCKTPA